MKIKFKASVVLLHILFWSLVTVLLWSLLEPQKTGGVPKFRYLRMLQGPFLFYINYLILVPMLLLKKRIFWYVLASILFLAFFNFLSVQLAPAAPRLETMEQFNEATKGFRFPPPPNGFRYMLPVTFSLSIFLLGGVFALITDFYKRDSTATHMEAKKKEMELQFLRTQLNPHFLFNSLNSIYSLVRSKSNDAPEAIIMLSELMRYMLYEVNENKVMLEKELNYIKSYISLQRMRLINSENVKLQIHGNTNELKIYPLVLITFIENAFKYGTDYKGNTNINVVIEIINNELLLNVDNIIGHHKKDYVNSGVGLQNINNQLEFLYKNKYSLITKEENGFYKVELRLKLV